jgi:acylphosphatase
MSDSAVRLIVSGRVQGVGFRWATRTEAERVGARGWVRNRPDGTVEIHLEGTDEAVAHMRRWAVAGPPGARVESVEELEVGAEGARSFEIRR